jgi:hypothetical protein
LKRSLKTFKKSIIDFKTLKLLLPKIRNNWKTLTCAWQAFNIVINGDLFPWKVLYDMELKFFQIPFLKFENGEVAV